MSHQLYRYLCKGCRHYWYARKHMQTCTKCTATDLRKDLVQGIAAPHDRRVRRKGCCGG